MALKLILESEFVSQLQHRGFERTDLQEGCLVVWKLNGEPYTVPMPIYTENDYNLYCPFAIELFFKHVFGEKSDIEINQHENKNFNITSIKLSKKKS